MLPRVKPCLPFALALLASGGARAQDGAGADALAAICTDRPTKANYACTVEPGHVQYEADLANLTSDKVDGVTTDTLLLLNPTLKYGVVPGLDVEANLSPSEIVQVHDAASRTERTLAGPSDLYLRLKYEMLDAEVIDAAIIPYVKAPTARRGLGDGAVEGGAILPVNFKINEVLTLTTAPEVDDLLDASGQGRHLATAELVNLAFALPANVTVYTELWGDWSFDPAGTVRQASFDTAVAYAVGRYVQLDIGADIGLNRATPGVQAYLGLSQKF